MSATKGTPCSRDADCIGAMICIPNATVPWVQAEFGTSICWCTGQASYVGEQCDELAPSGQLVQTYFICGIILAVISLCANIWCLWGLRRVAIATHSKEITLSMPLVQTAILCGLFSVSTIIVNALALQCSMTHDFAYIDGIHKLCPNEIVIIIIIAFTGLFMYLALLNVSVAWLAIVENVQRLSSSPRMRNSVKMVAAVRLLEVTYTAAVIGSMAALNFSLVISLLLPFLLVMIILYIVAGWYLSKLLRHGGAFQHNYGAAAAVPGDESSGGAERRKAFHRTLRRVQLTVLGVVFFITACIILTAAGTLWSDAMTGTQALYERGGWDRTGTFLSNAGLFSGLLSVCVVQWFVWVNARAKIAKLDGVIAVTDSGGIRSGKSPRVVQRGGDNGEVAARVQVSGSHKSHHVHTDDGAGGGADM